MQTIAINTKRVFFRNQALLVETKYYLNHSSSWLELSIFWNVVTPG